MAPRSNAFVTALANVVRLYPRLSAGLAFELGVLAGAFIKSARVRGLSGASARVIEAVPLVSEPRRRRTAKRKPLQKRKTAKRAAQRKAA